MQLDLEEEHFLYLKKKATRRRFFNTAAILILPLAAAVYFFIYYEPIVSEQEHLNSAQAYYQSGEIQTAAIALKNALKANPGNTEARFLLGKIYLELELGAPAEKELKRSLSETTDVRQLNQMLAQAQLLQDKPKEALQTLQSSTENPEQFSLSENLLLGQIYFSLREWGNANDSYNRALTQAPGVTAALIGLGKVAYSKGDIAIAKQYVGQTEDSAKDNWEAWSLKGDLARSDGKLKQAKQDYEMAFNLKTSALDPRLFHALIAIGEKNFDEATQDSKALLKHNSKHPAGHYIQGQIHFSRQEFELAQTSFELAIRFTDYPPVIRQLAITHFQMGNFAQAESYLKDYLELAPQDTEVQKVLSATYIQQNKLEDAKLTLQSIASTTTLSESLQLMMAGLEQATGKSEKAAEILNGIIDKNPESLEAQLQLGQTLLATSNAQLALETLTKAEEQEPLSTSTKLLIIKAHLQLQQYESALMVVDQLKKLEPDNPQFSSLDGIIYLAEGNQENAKESFKKSQAKYPDDILSAHQLALIAIENKNFDEAREYYLAILAYHTNHLPSQIQLGLVESAAGHPELAQKTLIDAANSHPENPHPKLVLAHIFLLADDPEKAISWLQQIKKNAQQSPQYLRTLVQAYMQNEQFVLATDTIVKLNKVKPSPGGYWLEAKARFEQKDMIGARTALQKAKILKPDTTQFDEALFEILVSETEISIQRKNYYAAKKNLVEIKKNLNPMPYLVLSARLEESQGNYLAAAKYYQQAQKLKPQTKILASLIRVLSLAGLVNQTEELATKWLQQYPDDYPIIYQLANAQLVANHVDKAITNYKKLLVVTPNDIIVLNNLAFLYTDKDPNTAVQYAKKAYMISPQNPAVVDTYGWITLQLGQHEKALNLLRKAHTLNPTIPGIQYHLASALANNAKNSDAIALLRGLSGDTFREKPEANALLYRLESGLE